jgi:hypothetical protein
MISNKTAKKRIVLMIFSVLVLVIMTVCVVQVRQKVLYDSVVGACSNQELTDRWQSRGEAYDIGVNSKGMVIFKDRKAALKQALKGYELGFEYLQAYQHLPKVSGSPKVCRKYALTASQQTSVPMTVENYEKIGQQCIQIAAFMKIYLNSFGE